MISRTVHLLSCLSEECAEVSQRVSKAIRFSLEEVQPGQGKSNAERISDELTDLFAVAGMLVQRGIIPPFGESLYVSQKRRKVEAFMEHAVDVGALEADEGSFLDAFTKAMVRQLDAEILGDLR